ncbi:MAG: Crp/Fnr family transcriptional regulator [Chloroflexia bacterium]|nr:Crp/Fnr family transcriptional regulator [Chloroflexia bacterium]
MYKALKEQLNAIVPISEKEWDIIRNKFVFRQVPKKFVLVKTDDIADEVYFVNKGLLRLYYEKDGEEITAFIYSEKLFASSYDSFLSKTKSNQCIDALEDCDLLVLSYQGMQELYSEVPKFNVIARIVSEQRFINAQRILSSFILDSPEERYLKFTKQFPNLIQRVPQHIIASYLGVTPVSLSRIRKRIFEK